MKLNAVEYKQINLSNVYDLLDEIEEEFDDKSDMEKRGVLNQVIESIDIALDIMCKGL